jgi:signal transduction histidine kinase/ligand-binding sensor domain-containing protein
MGQERIEREQGAPYPNEHYSSEEYLQHPQNWDIAQDDRGIVYVANNNGVLEYDGERWRTISTTTKAFVRSLAVDSLVYVGGTGDFGYLKGDSTHTRQYVSLRGKLSAAERDFEDVWNTYALDEGVYYQSQKRLFRWDGERIQSWESEEGFHTSFSVRGRFFVRDFQRGLLEMEGDTLRQVPRGEEFTETPIYMMAPYPGGKILIGTQNRGLLLYDGTSLEPFAPSITPYLQDQNLYHGCALPDGRYALATLGGGVVIIDQEGEVDRVLDGDDLPGSVVNHLYAGKNGTLWMALNSSGVFRANVGNALTMYGDQSGLGGLIADIDRHEGRIHATTVSGLYTLTKEKQEGVPVSGWTFQRRSGVSLGKELLPLERGALLATQEGIYQQRGEEWDVAVDVKTLTLAASKTEDVVYAGGENGLMRLRPLGETWEGKRIQGFSDEVRSIREETPGVLWVSNTQGEIFRIRLSEDRSRVREINQLGLEEELPEGFKPITRIGEKIFIITKRAVFEATERNGEIRLEERRNFLPKSGKDPDSFIYLLKQGPSEDLWLARGDRVYRGEKINEGGYNWESIEALHFSKTNVIRLHIEEDGIVWLGSGTQLFRYDPSAQTAPIDNTFEVHVRQVMAAGTRQVLYGGAPRPMEDSVLTVPYRAKNLRFEVAAPFYETTGKDSYQFRLKGRDSEWSDWSESPDVTFTNLWEGSYQFEVRARINTGAVSPTTTFAVYVQPPWYRTIWAYLVYLGFVGMVGFVAYRLYHLRQVKREARKRADQLRRERVVNERLKEANDQLREANRLKEEFLTNISHELRTPLTNILGFADVLREQADEEQRQHLDIVESNSRRLLDTLNALLDLATLRSGDADLDLEPVDVRRPVQETVEEVRPQAKDKDIEARAETPEVPAHAVIDERYLDQVLRNLLENAVKFTEDGYVSAAVQEYDEYIEVTVTDTGIGIDEEFLPQIFDDFKQESRGMSRTYEGSGLGLAISQRLVDLMDGTISVESTKGEGSTFIVRLPRALDAEEADPGANGQSRIEGQSEENGQAGAATDAEASPRESAE